MYLIENLSALFMICKLYLFITAGKEVQNVLFGFSIVNKYVLNRLSSLNKHLHLPLPEPDLQTTPQGTTTSVNVTSARCMSNMALLLRSVHLCYITFGLGDEDFRSFFGVIMSSRHVYSVLALKRRSRCSLLSLFILHI